MISFSTTTDYRMARSILTNAKVYRRMCNDSAPRSEDFVCGPRPGLTYVLAEEDALPVGLFLLSTEGQLPGSAQVHFCFIPEVWGNTYRIAREFLEWVWRTSSLNRLVGPVPAYNGLALRLARSVGFRESGAPTQAVRKGGVEWGLLPLEILRRC